jgi:UDP-N-acetylglucosamine diphosphorylase / glucose-1-phosphate thymidylyltransferase / UDP-N-acetylgalactosamine diphosphorylase / glucosamine-1-phosphate N-acetyltransferase / galactosamine-1-phosphate N-acetyltransferase
MQLCIFEDKKASNFCPLALNRPVYELVCGYSSLKDKILRLFPKQKYTLHCRKYLQDVVTQQVDVPVNSIEEDSCLFINGRVLDENLPKILSKKQKENIIYTSGENLVAAYLSGDKLQKFKQLIGDSIDFENFNGLPIEQVEIKTVNYLWDLIYSNGEELRKDFVHQSNRKKKKNQKKLLGEIYDGVHLVNKKEIIIEKGAVIKPGAVLDASNGPIYIDKNVEIFPNVVIEGPVYVGESSKIKSAATVYENTSIGKVCKIGGEVEASIIMPYTNKQHSGFLGHAYLGSWINLGADTNNSDLKNNYSTVKMFVNGKMVDSGSQFMGLVMGDHSKSAINTMFNTGTVVGFSCNIFGSGFPDKYIPSFSWVGAEGNKTYEVDKSIQTANKVMARRNIEMSSADEKLFYRIFELTDHERNKLLIA